VAVPCYLADELEVSAVRYWKYVAAFLTGFLTACVMFLIILYVNAPVERGMYLDLYTGNSTHYSRTPFSSTSESRLSPAQKWAKENGDVDPRKQGHLTVHLAQYRKPWFSGSIHADYCYFDVPTQVYQHQEWSSEQKIARLKEYHADLNAYEPDEYIKRVMKKWAKIFWPEKYE
jgi:hypothetical protein